MARINFRNDPFWQSARVLLRYKRYLAVGLFGALVSAGCFGAGLGMLVAVFKLLIYDNKTLYGMVDGFVSGPLSNPALPPFFHNAGLWTLAHVPTDRYRGFLYVMGAIMVLTLIGSSGEALHEYVILTVSQRAALIWRGRMFRRLIHAPLSQLFQTGTADHISRLLSDTASLEVGYRAILGRTVAEITKGGAALAAALFLDWRLTLITLIAAPVIAVVLRKFGKRIRRASKKAMQQRGRIVAALNEALGGLSVVKVHNAEGYERRRFGRINRDLYTQEMKMRQARSFSSPVIDSVAIFAVICVASIAAGYIFIQHKNPDVYFTVLAALAAAGGSLKPLTALHNQLSEASASAGRVMDVLALPVEPTGAGDTTRAPMLPRHSRSIVFDHVSFSYPKQSRQAINAIDLEVRHGQTIAIVGTNGSGKTTLLTLLPRLIEPSSGRVLIDGIDITTVSLRSLRNQIAVVTQQNILFEGTIAQNIAYGRRYEPMERIQEAAKAAYADDFINALPLAYEAKLGEGGTGLSGGQRQRLCIARAVLRDPAILILDEATSQIDAESEAKINQAIRSLRHGRTIFIIAHRLSTVVDADRIVVMSNGEVVDQGTHTELLKRCGAYQMLTQTQLLPPAA